MESISQTLQKKNRLHRVYILQRLALVASIVLMGNTLSYIPVYYQHPDWRLLLPAIALSGSESLLGLLAHRALLAGKTRTGYIGAALFFLMLPIGATLTNLKPPTLIATVLAVFLTSLLIWGNRWERWLFVTLGYGVYVLSIAFIIPLPSLTPEQASALTFPDTLAAIIFALLLLYELVRLLPELNIRSRLLVASLGVVLVPVITITALSIYFASSGGRQQVTDHLTSVVQLKQNQIALWEDSLLNSLQTLLSDPQASSRYENLLKSENQAQRAAAFLQVDQQFQQYIATTSYFEELFLLSLNGEVIYSTNPRRQGEILSNATFFQRGLLEASIQPPTYDPATQQSTIVVSRPVSGPDKQTIGVIAGRANLEVLNTLMQERAGLGETGETYLVGLNHALLTDVRESDAVLENAYIDSEGVRQALQSKSTGAGEYRNYAGEEVLGAYTWVPELQSALLAERQLSDAFSEVYVALSIMAGLSILAGILATAVALYLTHGISDPLAELVQTAEHISAGNIEVQAPVHGQDEIGTLAMAFNAMTTRLRSLISTLEERVSKRTAETERRSHRLEAVAQIGSAIATIRDMDVLLERVTRLISDRLGYYHVGIFLLDEEGEYAVLRATNSEGGRRMLARRHRLKVGQASLVGYATGYRQPRLAVEADEDEAHLANLDLPDTRSEIALPLISGQTLLGALDVQSTEPDAFGEEDIHILQLLSDQLAVAIENARLFTQTQQALEEAQRAYGELSQQAWLRMLEEGILSGGYRSGSRGLERLSSSAPLPPLAQQAIHKGGFVQHIEEEAQQVAFPLRVRGATIGVVETYKPRQAGKWSVEELETLQNIVDELGEALEGARLYTEINLRAENERRLAEIASQVRASLDTEDILQTAVRHIQQAFALTEVEIRMESPDEE